MDSPFWNEILLLFFCVISLTSCFPPQQQSTQWVSQRFWPLSGLVFIYLFIHLWLPSVYWLYNHSLLFSCFRSLSFSWPFVRNVFFFFQIVVHIWLFFLAFSLCWLIFKSTVSVAYGCCFIVIDCWPWEKSELLEILEGKRGGGHWQFGGVFYLIFLQKQELSYSN